jgi:hypothetical protein
VAGKSTSSGGALQTDPTKSADLFGANRAWLARLRLLEGDTVIWFRIGSHSDCDSLIERG